MGKEASNKSKLQFLYKKSLPDNLVLLCGFLKLDFKKDVEYNRNWKDDEKMCEPDLVRLIEEYEQWLWEIGLGGTSLLTFSKTLGVLHNYFGKAIDLPIVIAKI